MSKAAKYLGIKRDILGKIFDNNTSYKNWIFKFEIKHSRIQVYNSDKLLINVFDNIKKTSEILDIPLTTLRRYIKTKKLYKNQFYFYKIF
jgi:hypothetical protein